MPSLFWWRLDEVAPAYARGCFGTASARVSRQISPHLLEILCDRIVSRFGEAFLSRYDPGVKDGAAVLRGAQAMAHAWKGYSTYSFGMDELQPIAKRGKNLFAGLGATIIDSLDTLYIMGMMDEYNK